MKMTWYHKKPLQSRISLPNYTFDIIVNIKGALRGGGVRASNWLSKGRRFESQLRRFFTPTPEESLPFLTPPLAETVN